MKTNRLLVTKATSLGERGFSLIATVTLMVLLALIAVGFLTLSATVIRDSNSQRELTIARDNARLALMLAIGELQKHAGPDQTITAPADLGASEEIHENHWTAVWKTKPSLLSGQVNPPSFFHRRDRNGGGLRDMRWEGNDLIESRKTFLVSGNEDGIRHEPFQKLNASSRVRLVAEGTVGKERVKEDGVFAPLVEVKGGADADEVSGGYAYWVGDLGTKANLGVLNPYVQSGGGSGWSDDWLQYLVSQEAVGEDLDGQPFWLDDEIKRKWVSYQSISASPTDGGQGTQRFLERRFHDFTHYSQGVLTDVRGGGLKKDLTAFIQSNGQIDDLADGGQVISRGLSVDDNLISPINADDAEDYLTDSNSPFRWTLHRHKDTSPKFGVLYDWFNSGGAASFGSERMAAIWPPRAAQPGPMDDSYDFLNPSPVSLKPIAEASISPVLVEGSIYYNISYYRDDANADYPYALRLHVYPRVSLWNPYNTQLTLDPLAFYLMVNGAKDLEFTLEDGIIVKQSMDMGLGGALRGSLLFSIEPVTMEPGQCLVFSPPSLQAYDRSRFSNNVLSSRAIPDPSLCFYFDQSNPRPGSTQYAFASRDPNVPDGRLPSAIERFREIFDVSTVQADDYRMLLKKADSGSWNLEDFRRFDQIQFVSCALQYGDDDEFPVVWNQQQPVEPVLSTTQNDARLNIWPDTRTRDGFRLRWFNEHLSNRLGSGTLVDFPQHMQTAPIANWNFRSSYSLRSPWENVTDEDPVFFGVYTRDLFDPAVSWDQMRPAFQGQAVGNPFGQPSEGAVKRVLFDVPRSEVELVSLGQLQHIKFSEYVWHPSYAFGNSLADPRLGEDGLAGTELERLSLVNRRESGWNLYSIGWPDEIGQRGDSPEKWAFYARGLLQRVMERSVGREEATVSYDLSYELNHTLWDRFFLSTGNRSRKEAFWQDPVAEPLPNGRMRPFRIGNDEREQVEKLSDYHQAASMLMLDGAFNVNSTSVEAWKAILGSTKRLSDSEEGAVFSRVLNAPGGQWASGDSVFGEAAWSGARALSEDEVERLAIAIVDEVKLRGPFLSLSDFVNRRLKENDESAKKGALQAAIDNTGLNADFEREWQINRESLPDYFHRDNIRDPTRIEQSLKPETQAWGAPGYLTQADVLQVIGPILSPRSDSFVVRAYGEARNKSGQITAQAWCEGIVQRIPEPVEGDSLNLNSVNQGEDNDFGRKFVLKSFRWLREEEV